MQCLGHDSSHVHHFLFPLQHFMHIEPQIALRSETAGLRFAAGYRRRFDSDLNEFTFGFGVGGVLQTQRQAIQYGAGAHDGCLSGMMILAQEPNYRHIRKEFHQSVPHFLATQFRLFG